MGAMPLGTTAADRLRITALALCLEEKTGTEIHGAHVEYIPDGVSRYHAIQPHDRHHVAKMLNRARAIRNGEMPPRPLNTPCNRCKYQDRCESVAGSRPSELL